MIEMITSKKLNFESRMFFFIAKKNELHCNIGRPKKKVKPNDTRHNGHWRTILGAPSYKGETEL